MPTAIINRRTVNVDTAEEHAAHQIAQEAITLLSLGARLDTETGPYVLGREITVEAHLPDHEYVTAESYTRTAVTVTQEIVDRAKAIVEEQLKP